MSVLYGAIMKPWPNDEHPENQSEAVEILKAIKKKNDKHRQFLQRLTVGKSYTKSVYDSEKSLIYEPRTASPSQMESPTPKKAFKLAMQNVNAFQMRKLKL